MDVNDRVRAVQQQWQKEYDRIATMNKHSIIMVCIVVVGSVGVALGITILVTRPLDQLQNGLRLLTQLDFEKVAEVAKGQSRLSEVSQCQQSFGKLERYAPVFLYLALYSLQSKGSILL